MSDDKRTEQIASVIGAFSKDSNPSFADLADLIGLVELQDLDHNDLKCWPDATCTAKIGHIAGADATVFTDVDVVIADVDGTMRAFSMGLEYTVESDGIFGRYF